MFKNILVFICVSLGVLLIASCEDNLICEKEKHAEYYSPDNGRALISYVENCGATTTNTYSFYLVRAENSSSRESLVLRAGKLIGLQVKWESNTSVLVKYNSARIFSFRNFWYDATSENMIFVTEIHKKFGPN